MKFLKIKSKQAIINFAKNKFSRWYKLGIDVNDKSGSFAVQRVKNKFFSPSIVTKGITINQSDNVFTIGSCFARGIEKALIAKNFNVLSASTKFDAFELINDKVTALGSTNKYNTFSILNEIEWALRPEKKFPNESIVKIGDDIYVDPFLNPTLKYIDKKGTLKRRKIIQRINSKIIDCELIVITLGLVEVWYDNFTKTYINGTPTKEMLSLYPNRYKFHVSSFQENFNNLQKIYKLLKKYCKSTFKIIITVSPVPLNATFTTSDVVVANTYSKSTLRCVAQEWSNQYDNVVYFPSYEIVMNSSKLITWLDDLRHVDGAAVQHIMDLFVHNFLAKEHS